MSSRTEARADLRRFLMSRRARISPADVGLPAGSRRRAPGLRREEVAVLAGVAPSWYQWLEQGRDINVSPQVLDSVARALWLDDAERRLLYGLAKVNPPLPDGSAIGGPYCDELHRLIDAWQPNPATMLDRYWNTLEWNESARRVLGLPDTEPNHLVGFFREPMYRRRDQAWQAAAPQVVATFRAAAAERPDDDGYRVVISQLQASCDEFAWLWSRLDVSLSGIMRYEVDHPVAGVLDLECSHMRLPARPDILVVLYTPVPSTDTATKIRKLLTL